MPEEIDTETLMRGWLEAGVPMALPRIDAASGEIRAYRIDGLDHLETNRWGIREPVPDPAAEVQPADLGVIVVPGLAFDKTGRRLGRGRGYYDRFLRAAGRGPLRAGLFYAIQELDRVPVGEHDETLDLIFTERGMIRCADDPEHS
jgi:5-formyltetrahydrofolate cyclo-ligase